MINLIAWKCSGVKQEASEIESVNLSANWWDWINDVLGKSIVQGSNEI